MRTHADLPGDGGSDVLGQVLAQRREVAERLSSVRSILAVTSGKGGVGKSTVTAALAEALAADGQRVAVLDADLNGPSLPRLFGLAGARPQLGTDGLVPPESAAGVPLMSTGLFLSGDGEPLRYDGPAGDAYTWRPTAEATTLRELLARTAWGERDWLLLDLPPGAERLPNLVDLVPNLLGTVVVTLGSALSLSVVKKSLTVAREHGVTVAGLVENMAGYPCSACGEIGPLHGQAGAAEAMAREAGVPFLGALPFERRLVTASERGEAIDLASWPEDDPARTALDGLVRALGELASDRLESDRGETQ